MPLFIDTRGNTTQDIGICARCSRKMPKAMLQPDPNAPGLLVCADDRDLYDPWRLPGRPIEKISVDQPRPDTPVLPPTGSTAQEPLTDSRLAGSPDVTYANNQNSQPKGL